MASSLDGFLRLGEDRLLFVVHVEAILLLQSNLRDNLADIKFKSLQILHTL